MKISGLENTPKEIAEAAVRISRHREKLGLMTFAESMKRIAKSLEKVNNEKDMDKFYWYTQDMC
jgi:hypothetical protein